MVSQALPGFAQYEYRFEPNRRGRARGVNASTRTTRGRLPPIPGPGLTLRWCPPRQVAALAEAPLH